MRSWKLVQPSVRPLPLHLALGLKSEGLAVGEKVTVKWGKPG